MNFENKSFKSKTNKKKEYQIKSNDNNKITKLIIDDISIILDEKALINVNLVNDRNNSILRKHIELSGEDYNNWGNDDNYIIQFICNKLNIQIV